MNPTAVPFTDEQFARLVERTHNQMVARVARHLGDLCGQLDPNSIVVSAWGAFAEHIRSGRAVYSPAGLVWRIAYNKTMTRIRRLRGDGGTDALADRIDSGAADPADVAELEEQLDRYEARVRAFLAREWTPDQRAALGWIFMGMTAAEVRNLSPLPEKVIARLVRALEVHFFGE